MTLLWPTRRKTKVTLGAEVTTTTRNPGISVELPDAKPGCDLSVVIVSYNTQEMTRTCLASVVSQSGTLRVQTIVVDNNSQDGSVAMIEAEFPEAELIVNSANQGFAAANNQAFARCRGRYVLLLNSDTIVLDEVLPASVHYLQRHPQIGAMGCQVLNTDRTIQPTCSGYPTLFRLLIMTLGLDRIPCLSSLDHYLMRHWSRENEREVEVVSGCYLMVRGEVLAEVGPLDERFFFFGEETDWCRRIRKAGWQLTFATVGRIVHHGGGSVKKLNYQRDVMLTAATVRLHRKHGGLVAALAAYLILLVFNCSRAITWSVLAFLKASDAGRANHFIKVVRSSGACWPKER